MNCYGGLQGGITVGGGGGGGVGEAGEKNKRCSGASGSVLCCDTLLVRSISTATAFKSTLFEHASESQATFTYSIGRESHKHIVQREKD